MNYSSLSNEELKNKLETLRRDFKESQAILKEAYGYMLEMSREDGTEYQDILKETYDYMLELSKEYDKINEILKNRNIDK